LTAAELAAFREDIAVCNERAADRLCRRVPRRDECTSTDESVNPDAFEDFAWRVEHVLGKVHSTLLAKNKLYGNSALEPIRILSRCDAAEQLRVRIDDKLSRLKQGLPDQEDTVHDLIGYLVLLTIATHKEQ
jgi:hypothetical protein